MLSSCCGILAESICTTIRPELRGLTDLFILYAHDLFGEKYMVLFHLIFLLCTTIRPKIGVHTDLFFFCTRPFDRSIWSSFIYSFFCVPPFDQKLRSTLIYFSMYTTIQPKVRVLINLFILFVHDHSTKN